MKRNASPEFIGYDALKEKLASQLAQFEAWAAACRWGEFHRAHYDWWMFPIDVPSSYGQTWTVYEGDIAELKKDDDYVRRYLRGVELQSLSWGWDLAAADFVADPQPDQAWQHWPVRLYKCARSVRLFGYPEQFASLRQYAQHLMREGEAMTFSGHDLSWLFRSGA